MRITRSLLPLSLLMVSCAPAARPPAASHQPAPVSHHIIAPPAPSPDQPSVTPYPSLREAVRAVLSSKPKIIAFGEVHNNDRNTKLPTTIEYFAEHVMPELAAAGRRHVIFENLPFGPEADKEIERFNNGEELGPILTRYIIESRDCRGIRQVLQKGKELGITLRGAHVPTYEEYEQRKKDGTLNPLISQHIIEVIQEWRKSDENMLIAIFGGLAHINVTVELSLSIAPMFLPDFKEVDILLGRDSYTMDEAEVDFPGWKTHTPLSGANLIHYPSGRIVIALPDHDLPLPQPTCPKI